MNNEIITIAGRKAYDDRGFVSFINDFNFMKAGIKRFYQVENHSKGYVRAWHGHKKEEKYVYVPQGTALIKIIKINNWKEPYNDWSNKNQFVLSSIEPIILRIPAGYVNGFKTLDDKTIVQFFSTSTLEESLGDDYRFEWNLWDNWEVDHR